MPKGQEVFTKAQDYLEGRLDLEALYTWVMDREPWGDDPETAGAPRLLVAGIEMGYWELCDGHRDEASVREIVREDLSQLTGQPLA